ncbi:MAG: transposase [Bacteroidetes bacterium]|nr:transposase [Bacteroidota bacterium]
MSRKYKFHNKEGFYFVSFATVYWIDVFVRMHYFDILVANLDYCRKNKGLEIYAWCIMPSHVHLIIRAVDGNPDILLGRFKEHISKQMQAELQSNIQESRRDWMLPMFREAGSKSSNVKQGQFWQHHNKPIELYSHHVTMQKLDYIHNNPVVAGFVSQAEHWRYSSAMDYYGGKGMLEIDLLI